MIEFSSIFKSLRYIVLIASLDGSNTVTGQEERVDVFVPESEEADELAKYIVRNMEAEQIESIPVCCMPPSSILLDHCEQLDIADLKRIKKPVPPFLASLFEKSTAGGTFKLAAFVYCQDPGTLSNKIFLLSSLSIDPNVIIAVRLFSRGQRINFLETLIFDQTLSSEQLVVLKEVAAAFLYAVGDRDDILLAKKLLEEIGTESISIDYMQIVRGACDVDTFPKEYSVAVLSCYVGQYRALIAEGKLRPLAYSCWERAMQDFLKQGARLIISDDPSCFAPSCFRELAYRIGIGGGALDLMLVAGACLGDADSSNNELEFSCAHRGTLVATFEACKLIAKKNSVDERERTLKNLQILEHLTRAKNRFPCP